jgi:Flp pilus assembly protein TadD
MKAVLTSIGFLRPCAAGLALLTLVACSHQRSLSAARPTTPAPPPVMKRQILNAVDAGDGDVVVRQLRREILEHPDRLDLRLELVDHFAKRGESELVVEHLRLLSERFPADESLHLRLARTLRADGARDEALRILRNLTSRQMVASPAVWSLTGILLDELERPMEGEAEHRRALEVAQADLDVYENNLGYNLLAQGRAAEAVTLFQSALRRRPRSEVARNNLGAALAARPDQELDKSAILAHWMSITDPASAHNNLAAVLIEKERYAEAREALEQSLRLRPDLAPAWKNLQLLSELDGQPVTLSPRKMAPKAVAVDTAKSSGWRRVMRGVRHTFVSDDPVLKPTRSTQRASR